MIELKQQIFENGINSKKPIKFEGLAAENLTGSQLKESIFNFLHIYIIR